MTWPQSDPVAQRWSAIAAGLLIGLGAKYAIMMQDRRNFGWRDLAIDVLLLAANALMASIVVERMNIHGQEAVAVAALFGASSDRVVRAARRAFEKKIDQQAAILITDTATPTVVPPSQTPVEVQFVDPTAPEMRPYEALREQLIAASSDDEIEALLATLKGLKE